MIGRPIDDNSGSMLPSDRSGTAVPAPRLSPPSDAAKNVARLLVVGTDEGELSTLTLLSRELDIDVHTARSGYEAITQLLRDPQYIALILDADIPAMKLFAFATLVRQSHGTNDIPIILLLNRSDQRTSVFAGNESGPVEVLYKPIEPHLLRAKLLLLLETARLRHLIGDEKAERIRLEKALYDTSVRYDLVGRATRDALYDWDLLTNVVQWNPTVYVEYGYPESATLGDSTWWYTRIHPDDLARIAREVDAFIASSNVRCSWEYRFRRADGTYAYVYDRGYIVRDPNGRPVRLIGAMQDMTARKLAEDALKESEQHFRRIEEKLQKATQASHVGVWEMDLRTLEVWRSKEHDRLMGYTQPPSNWSHDVFYAHVHPDDREYLRRVESAVAHQGSDFHSEYRVIWPDGSTHWIASQGKVELDANGRPVRVSGTSRDITERKRIEEELREAVRARDEFLSIASHELKTPLTAIGLQAEIIKRAAAKSDDFTPERAVKFVQHIDRQVKRLTRIVDDMLDISRLATGKLAAHPETFDLSDAVNDVVERMEPQLTQLGSPVTVDTVKGVVGAWDRFRIEQVVMNLLTNAARYGEGKAIEVSVRRTQTHAELRVRDHGRGIAKDDQVRIFQRFERVASDTQVGGLGLGLFIVRQILSLHNGSIRVESNVGHGALFIVELPLAKRPD